MKYLLIDAIIEETLINKFYGAAYQGLNNNLLGNCVINLYMCFGLINSGGGGGVVESCGVLLKIGNGWV